MSDIDCTKHDWKFEMKKITIKTDLTANEERNIVVAKCKLCGKEVEFKEGITTNEKET